MCVMMTSDDVRHFSSSDHVCVTHLRVLFLSLVVTTGFLKSFKLFREFLRLFVDQTYCFSNFIRTVVVFKDIYS